MSKTDRPNEIIEANSEEQKEQAFEMIELAIDQSELLTRAFDIIGQVCCEQLSMAIDSSEIAEPILQ